MRAAIRSALALLIALAAASCARTAPDSPEPVGPATLVVDNQSTFQVTIYAHQNSQRQRLGIARSLGITRLTIPDNLIHGPTTLRFEVDPVGSPRQPISESIMVSRGEEVTLRIPASFR